MAAPSSETLDWDGLITSTMRKYLSTSFQDQIFNKLVFWAWLAAKGRKTHVDGGDLLVEPLMYGRNGTVASMGDLDTIDVTPHDGLTAALFNWKLYAGTLVFSKVDKLKNSGRSKIIDLLTARTQQLEMSFQEKMNQDALGDGTGNDGKTLTGLQAIVNDSGVLGNIDSGTYTWWQSYKEDTVEALSKIDRLRTAYNSTGKQKSRPEFILTTQDGYEWYEALAQAKLNIDQTQKGNPLADLGFETLKYKGAIVTYDEEQTAGRWDLLNSQYLRLRVHKDADFARTEQKEPVDKLAFLYQVYWFGNLTTSNRSRLGCLTGKTYTLP